MRLFAALHLPEDLLHDVAVANPLPPTGAREVPPVRWHLTLAFYGELDGSGLDCLAETLARRLDRLAPAPAIALRARGGGVFHGGAAHIALAGHTASDDARLRSVALVCRRSGLACRAPGVSSDDERFSPHLTVARFRRGARPSQAYRAALRAVSGGPWTCGGVDLVESFLGPSPRYEVRRRYPLPLR